MEKEKNNMQASSKPTKETTSKGGCGCGCKTAPMDDEEVVEIEEEDWKY